MMVFECLGILAVIGCFIFITARSGRREAALAFLPLLLVPALYLCSAPLSSVLKALLPIERIPLAIGVTVLGLVAACVLFGMLCGNFQTRRARRGYLIMCGGFSAILAVILILNLMKAII